MPVFLDLGLEGGHVSFFWASIEPLILLRVLILAYPYLALDLLQPFFTKNA